MDLGRAHAPIAAELRAAFERVLQSERFVLGGELERFEHEFASYCGTRYCVGVASGTAALTIMLQSAGVQPGDEVIVPAHTFIATALAVAHAGARPVCVDVRTDTGLIDPDAVAAAIGPATSAILGVHLYGQVCQMDSLRQLADRHGLLLLEDAAQAHGATYRSRQAGGLGRAGAFSFYPSKNMGALGDAGAICTDDPDLATAARRLRDLGRSRPGGASEVVGYNERLDALQAAFLQVKLEHLDSWNSQRRQLARAYRERLSDTVELLGVDTDTACVYHLFPVRIDGRDTLAGELAARGIGTGVHYPLSLPDQPAIRALVSTGRARSTDSPNAADWAARELSLPIFPGLLEREVGYVASAIRELIGQREAASSPVTL
jgi:dTDP-3-amino-3,4,6-trideoxy-alpha-D-glucose transaminase